MERDLKNLRLNFADEVLYLRGLLDMKLYNPQTYAKMATSGILEMVKEGNLSPLVLTKLNSNSDLSPEVYADLEAVKAGRSIVPEFPEGTPLSEAFSQTKLGDAVEVGQKMYINDGNELVEWQMTKEKFLELFPPVKRFATVQGRIGDCYLVSSISACLNNPKARVQIYKSFKLDGDDVTVTIKGYEDFKGSKTFKDGKIKLDKSVKHIIGCKGAQMLEQTYATCALREPSLDYLPTLDESLDTYSLMQRIQSGVTSTAMSELLGLKDWDTEPLNIIKVLKRATVNIRGNSGANYIKTLANRKDCILHLGTISKPQSASESMLLKEYNLVSSHTYEIVGYNQDTDKVIICNPHSAGVYTEIPYAELVKYLSNLYITSLD